MSRLLARGHSEQPPARPADEQKPQAGQPHSDGARSAVVERATGVVMALGRLEAGQAGTVLSEVSQRVGIALDRVAELLTVWAPTGELNLGLRIALEEAIRDQHPASPRTTLRVSAHADDQKPLEGEDHAVDHA